jgi:hypothetical protein
MSVLGHPYHRIHLLKKECGDAAINDATMTPR